MKKTIILFFITTLITLSCCKNKESKDLNYIQLNQIAKNMNADLEHISNDMNDLTLILNHNISFDKPVKWDASYLKKNNTHYFIPYQEKSSAIYLPDHVSLNDHIKKMIINSEEMNSLFIKFIHDNVFVQQIYFLDTNSFLRIYPYTDVYQYLTQPIELKSLLPYQKVNQKPFIEDQSYWVETPYADPYGRGWIISCIEPVYYHDEFIGILSADIPVKKFLEKYFKDQTQILILTDNKGNVICTTQPGCKQFNIPAYRDFSYYKPVTQNILMYNSPPLAKHQNKGMREAIHKLLKNSFKENFYVDRKKHTIYKAEIKETNWLLLKIIY